MDVIGEKTETDPGEGVESPLVKREVINNYFMDTAAGNLLLNPNGSSYEEFSGSKRRSTIMIKLEFRSIPSILALPLTSAPPPPLEDWIGSNSLRR